MAIAIAACTSCAICGNVVCHFEWCGSARGVTKGCEKPFSFSFCYLALLLGCLFFPLCFQLFPPSIAQPPSHLSFILGSDLSELGDLAEDLLTKEAAAEAAEAAKNQGSLNADNEKDASSSSESCGDCLKRLVAGKIVNFLEGSLPPVTGTFRRAYVTIEMALTYSTLAITTVINVYTAVALMSMPINPDALLLGFVPQVHLYAFYILCIEAVRLLSAVSAVPFQV